MVSLRGVLLALVVSLVVIAAWFIGDWKRGEEGRGALSSPVEPQHTPQPTSQKATERLALAKAKQREALARGKAVLGALGGIEAAIASWEEQVSGLLTSDAGRQLALRDDHVRKFLGLLEEKRFEKWEVWEARRRVEALLTPVEEALHDPSSSYTPPAALMVSLQREFDWADEALRAYEERRAKLQTMLTFAQLGEPGPKTLAQALREVRGHKP